MRYLKYFSILIFSMLVLTSCFEEGPNLEENALGSNVAGFANSSENLAGIADNSSEYTFNIKVKVTGPTSMDLTEDVVLTFGASAASTAIEGTHFRLDNPTVTLTKANNYLGEISVTMLTLGIEAPLAVTPVLVLEATQVSGPANVVPSGKTVACNLSYACFSNLSGVYAVTVLRDGGEINPYSSDVTITETGIGEYRTNKVGHWDDIGGTPGYTFYDVCDVLTVPGQNLVELYSNWVHGDESEIGSHDPETGILHTVYKITSSWESEYDNTYVPL